MLCKEQNPLPGGAVMSVAETDQEGPHFHNRPDLVVNLFNSPFGPEVLVATDALSEGIDLHRYCRHLIHHELDASPIRIHQRNGRLRRLGSWAARTGKPIRIAYPSFPGTRDERLVEIVRQRLAQFDLLLGGVPDVDNDAIERGEQGVMAVLAAARKELAAEVGRLGVGRQLGSALSTLVEL
jgi:superfamily II DNA/RNA helicase